ncbi:hypothetical protein EDB92DRAFT_1987736 [Lactarius akahatsu]|uniref:Uncharacterized protein n=1 Tax=Lactarius akahatsu TaxID=416441 RepID=A0AAD4LGC7_9AGAM|nr:hypothetical protein EDB92DRAFT_1987736 [Lactarius akahatsu]
MSSLRREERSGGPVGTNENKIVNELGANGETSPDQKGEEHVSRGVTRGCLLGCLALTGPSQAGFHGQPPPPSSFWPSWSNPRTDDGPPPGTLRGGTLLHKGFYDLLALIPTPSPSRFLWGKRRCCSGSGSWSAIRGPRYEDLPGPNSSLRGKVAPPVVNLPPSGPVSPKKGRRISKDMVSSTKPTSFVYCSLAIASLLYIVPRDDVQAASSGDSIDPCFRPHFVFGHSTAASYDNKVNFRGRSNSILIFWNDYILYVTPGTWGHANYAGTYHGANYAVYGQHRDDPYRDNLWSEGALPPTVRLHRKNSEGKYVHRRNRISVTPTPENPNTCLSLLAHPVESMPVPQDSPNDGIRGRIPPIPDVAGAFSRICVFQNVGQGRPETSCRSLPPRSRLPRRHTPHGVNPSGVRLRVVIILDIDV